MNIKVKSILRVIMKEERSNSSSWEGVIKVHSGWKSAAVFCGITGRPTKSTNLCPCVDTALVKASGKSGSGCQEWALSGLGAGRCHRDERGSVGPVFGHWHWLPVGFLVSSLNWLCAWAGRPHGNPEERWVGLNQSVGHTWEKVVTFRTLFVRRLIFPDGLNARKEKERGFKND